MVAGMSSTPASQSAKPTPQQESVYVDFNKPQATKPSILPTSVTPTWKVTTAPANPNMVLVHVQGVVDGDTFVIDGGKTVRFIGIDTPETVDPRKPVQCFGKEASVHTTALLKGNVVGLVKDVSETDRYGRLLRYVYIGDTFINQELVREGYAHAVSYPPDIKYQEIFRKAEQEARANNRGLWSACSSPTTSNTSSSTSSKQSTSTTGTSRTTSNTSSGNTQPVSNGTFSCDCSKTCSQISSCAEAQYQLKTCGCSARDADGDGFACDGAPLHCQQ